MRHFFLLVIVILILASGYYFVRQYNNTNSLQTSETPQVQNPSTPTSIPQKNNPISTSIFVPYWNSNTDSIQIPEISNISSTSSTLIYFGIKPGSNGINRSDEGYQKISDVGSGNILTVRMLDSDQNLTILRNKRQQQAIIDDTIEIAKANGYKGVLIDFEITALPFQELTNQITDFIKLFSQNLKSNQLTASMTVYGDHFYRVRPFDLQALNPFIDNFYVMTYDLHKAGGSPGPNFPLKGQEVYGTDLQTTIEKLTAIIPPEKITTIFGMYGYDWMVDEKKRPVRDARAKSLQDIRREFLDACTWQNCVIKRDDTAAETEINYVDDNSRFHIVWFEDEESVEKKIEYLKTKGITSYSFWVWGYY